MSVESKQLKIEIIRNATNEGENTCERIAESFTLLNNEKLEKDSSNLTQQDADALKIKLGIANTSDVTYIDKIGTIDTTPNNVTINLDVSGENKVFFNNIPYSVFIPITLNYTPVSVDKIKVLVIYALPTAQLFYIAEGEEGYEAKDPTDFPDGYLLVSRITVTPEGQYIDPNLLSGFKEKAEDNWKSVLVNKVGGLTIYYNDSRTCFSIEETTPSTTTKILQAIEFSEEITRDVDFIIKNNTAGTLQIINNPTDGAAKGFVDNTPFSILSKGSVIVKYSHIKDVIEILKFANSEGITTVVTDSSLEGSGNIGSPLKLSSSKNAEIAGKTTMTAVISYVTGLGYATNIDLTSGLANRYQITTTNITAPDSTYQWMILTDGAGITRRMNFATYMAANFVPTSAQSVLKYGTQNPPTLAQLTALGIKRGDYYVQTSDGTSSGTEIQRAPFNGVQLTSWAVTTAIWNTLSNDQKNAIKSIEILP